jgi:PPE-repeat protein
VLPPEINSAWMFTGAGSGPMLAAAAAAMAGAAAPYAGWLSGGRGQDPGGFMNSGYYNTGFNSGEHSSGLGNHGAGNNSGFGNAAAAPTRVDSTWATVIRDSSASSAYPSISQAVSASR